MAADRRLELGVRSGLVGILVVVGATVLVGAVGFLIALLMAWVFPGGG